MKRGFPYPLPIECLGEFVHPDLNHEFASPSRHGDEVIAANGYVVIRATRGRWLDADFSEASAGFMARVDALPWSHAREMKEDKWKFLDGAKRFITARARLGMFSGTRVAASPVWLVGDVLVRLSVLQAVALLPRVEVAWTDRALPLWFRFSGGIGAIAADWRLRDPAFSILQAGGPVGHGSLR